MRYRYHKDDYIGFTYNGIHSSQFGLFSVTNGDRYSRGLSPQFEDIITNVAGQDGSHYFGTRMKQRDIAFKIAFDDVTEQEFHELRRWLNCGIKPLILDETPYIQYFAKIQSMPSFNFVPFTEEFGKRIYKGELDLHFICYDPYGYSVSKWLDDYGQTSAGGVAPINLYVEDFDEWAPYSRLQKKQVSSSLELDTFQGNGADANGGSITLYNGGDVATDYRLNIEIKNQLAEGSGDIESDKIELKIIHNLITTSVGYLDFTKAKALFKDYTFQGDESINFEIDTKKHLVIATVIDSDGVTRPNGGPVVGNDCFSGDFNKIPVSENMSDFSTMKIESSTVLKGAESSTYRIFGGVSIDYQYKYY